jgi:hypothetical protein
MFISNPQNPVGGLVLEIMQPYPCLKLSLVAEVHFEKIGVLHPENPVHLDMGLSVSIFPTLQIL